MAEIRGLCRAPLPPCLLPCAERSLEACVCVCMRGSQLVLPSSPGRSVTFNSHRWSLLQGLKVPVAQRGTVSLGTLAEWGWGWSRGFTSQPLCMRFRISAPLRLSLVCLSHCHCRSVPWLCPIHGLQYARLSVLHYILESAQILVR